MGDYSIEGNKTFVGVIIMSTAKKNQAKGVLDDVTLLTDHDIYLFKEGHHYKLYDKLGSHALTADGRQGTYFAVWAPNAVKVSVIGDFNQWQKESHPLKLRQDESGIWEGFIPELGHEKLYKYHIKSRYDNYRVDKGDPFAFHWETPPRLASIVWDINYDWKDGEWMTNRHKSNHLKAPFSIYEVHLGSWRRIPEEGNRFLTYREMAGYLPIFLMTNMASVISTGHTYMNMQTPGRGFIPNGTATSLTMVVLR